MRVSELESTCQDVRDEYRTTGSYPADTKHGENTGSEFGLKTLVGHNSAATALNRMVPGPTEKWGDRSVSYGAAPGKPAAGCSS
jgi:hypothetical protein